jgi:hypothetical protein
MENLPRQNNDNTELKLQELRIIIEEMKRRLIEQKTFEPGEKEMYEQKIKEGEIYLMNPGSHKN